MMFDLKSVLIPGMNFAIERMLDESDTAAHYGSSKLGHLIASPVYVGIMIDSAVKTVEDRLPEGLVSVGRSMTFTHDAPTSLGMNLRMTATLKDIVGDRLYFDITAYDDCGEIGHGTHERVVVHKEALFKRANQRLLHTTTP
ncbi:MAG: hypothetical protein H6Q74_532 [Firmicutes bacterium]|nr:hypothetical protein [Bacillota bacterium]